LLLSKYPSFVACEIILNNSEKLQHDAVIRVNYSKKICCLLKFGNDILFEFVVLKIPKF